MTFLMVMTVLAVFMFFSLGLDAGLWYFDHRSAQNQADAAALAAVLLALRLRNRKDVVAFTPFMVGATAFCMFYMDLYLWG